MNQDKFRILVLADAASFHAERFVEELRNLGTEVLLASLETAETDYHKLKRKGIIKQLHYINAVSELVDLVNSFRPDIISAHYTSGYGHIGAKLKKKTSVPLTVNLWGSDILIVPDKSFLHKNKVITALKEADHVFADSHYLIKQAIKIYNFDNYSVIPWGIEKRFLTYRKSKFDFSSPLKILVPRAHESVYNNNFILEALLPLIRDNSIEVTFPSFGSQYKLFYEKSVDISGGKIKFYDKFSRADYLSFASNHDVYLSASLSDSSPVSLIEAMALGLLPVVGNIEGVHEWLNTETGILYELDNQNSLFQVIEKIVNSNDSYEQLRLNNYKKVEKKAIFESNLSNQLEIFKKITKGPR